MNLRKCVDHPYLFDGEMCSLTNKYQSEIEAYVILHMLFPVSCAGVEPEPFEMGEHLIEASGKLCLLDSMLTYLHEGLVPLLVIGLHLVATEAHADCCYITYSSIKSVLLYFSLHVCGEAATASCCSLR